MGRSIDARRTLGFAGILVCLACGDGSARQAAPDSAAAPVTRVDSAAMARPQHSPEEVQRYVDAARDAWRFVDSHYHESTGLVSPVDDYDVATTWDIGSGLAAMYSAHRLGFLSDEDYDARMTRALRTLATVGMFRGVAFNRDYLSRQVGMAEDGRPSSSGYAWNVTDLGRLLVWLKIIAANEPKFASQIGQVIGRIKFDEIVRGGYLYSEVKTPRTRSGIYRYQEGRLGYEQYSAAGFALWGARPQYALDMTRNAVARNVLGQELYVDGRGYNRLTSEPFILMGLEVGWGPALQRESEALLAAQRARFEKTGQITMASEDAIAVPPHYFYYYLVYGERGEFVIDVQEPGATVDGPRTVSAKAAFAWNALLPSDYTRKALEYVGPALGKRGWSSGVFEGSGKSTNTPNVNTAAVILESALFLKNGGVPLLGQPFDWPS